jgi:hypothetical protein
MVKKTKGLDVRTREQMKELLEMLNTHKTVIVLVHADYCGHCQTYKERVWNNLSPGQNGMAAIHYDQLEGTPLENAKLKGYPSILVVKKKENQTPEEPEPLEIGEFDDEENPGQTTNAISNEKANDPKFMEDLLNATKPTTLLSRGSTGIIENAIDDTMKSLEASSESASARPSARPSALIEEETPEKTLELDRTSEKILLNKSKSINAVRNRTKRSPLNERNVFAPVPDPSNDILDTQEGENVVTPFTEAQGERPSEKGVTVGGSLYSSLLSAAGAVAPAAALTGAAMLMKRKTRRGKKMRGGKRNSRKGKRKSRKTA